MWYLLVRIQDVEFLGVYLKLFWGYVTGGKIQFFWGWFKFVAVFKYDPFLNYLCRLELLLLRVATKIIEKRFVVGAFLERVAEYCPEQLFGIHLTLIPKTRLCTRMSTTTRPSIVTGHAKRVILFTFILIT